MSPEPPELDLPGLLADLIRPGDGVVWGQASAEPIPLVRALAQAAPGLFGVRAFCGLTVTASLEPSEAAALALASYGAHGPLGVLANAGSLDLVPCHLSDLPRLFERRILRADVALACLSPAGPDGWHTLGTGVGFLADALPYARTVIAEVNDRMPVTSGPTGIHRDDPRLRAVLWTSRPLPESCPVSPDPVCEAIAARVAGLIPDRATLQLGVGRIPAAVARALGGHRDLGVHSGMVDDALVDLIESGAVTNAHKGIDQGVSIAGLALGTERLYRHVDRNPEIEFRPVSYTHDAQVLSSLRRLAAVNGAVEVDLTGAVNAEAAPGSRGATRAVGGVGGQGDFLRGAARSAGGMPIVALPSTTGGSRGGSGGTRSCIVAQLSGPVTTARNDVHFVVTEEGTVALFGRSLRERARLMIGLAHPAFREDLERAARGLVGEVRRSAGA